MFIIFSGLFSQMHVEQKADPDDVDSFENDIKGITEDLETYAFQLGLKDNPGIDKDIRDYKKKHGCHIDRLKDSIETLTLLSNNENETNRKTHILQYAQKSCKLIKDNSDEFYKHNRNWKDMNDVMLKSNEVLTSLFSKKGMKISNAMTGCLLFFLEAESIQKLDSFWTEYQDGELANTLRKAIFGGSTSISDLTLIITEDKYLGYRKFLGKCFYF